MEGASSNTQVSSTSTTQPNDMSWLKTREEKTVLINNLHLNKSNRPLVEEHLEKLKLAMKYNVSKANITDLGKIIFPIISQILISKLYLILYHILQLYSMKFFDVIEIVLFTNDFKTR